MVMLPVIARRVRVGRDRRLKVENKKEANRWLRQQGERANAQSPTTLSTRHQMSGYSVLERIVGSEDPVQLRLAHNPCFPTRLVD